MTKRIIPCLDVKGGQVVKGTKFVGLKSAGNPGELAKKYSDEGADELALLDISASAEQRGTMLSLVKEVAGQISIPLTVGGGIRNEQDIEKVLVCGADKISISTAAVKSPGLIQRAAKAFGSQCIVIAIDAKKCEDSWRVYISGGMERTGLDVIDWAKEAEAFGAGGILLTSIDRDGTNKGFDVELTKQVSNAVGIPVIASGGAGDLGSIVDVLKEGGADAALAASIFHYGKYTIREVKEFLQKNNVLVRL